MRAEFSFDVRDRQIPQAAPGLTHTDVVRALHSEDSPTVLGMLAQIKAAGEYAAFHHNYHESVCQLLGHDDSEVAAAAVLTLASLGGIGAVYCDYMLVMLREHASATCRRSAAEAVGLLGPVGRSAISSLTATIQHDADCGVRVAATQSLGTLKAVEQLELLTSLLEGSSEQVAAASCDAIVAMGCAEARKENIVKQLNRNGTKACAISALACLGKRAPESCSSVVAESLGDGNPVIRKAACDAVSAGVAVPASTVAGLLSSELPGARCAAAISLGTLRASEHADAILELLSDGEEDASALGLLIGGCAERPQPQLRKPRCAALHALGLLQLEMHTTVLLDALDDEDYEVRCCALDALLKQHPRSAEVPARIAAKLTDFCFPVRAKACAVLGELMMEDEVDTLALAMSDTAPAVRAAAARALGKLGEPAQQYSHELFQLTSDNAPSVRAAAVQALGGLGDTGLNYASVIGNLLFDADPAVRVAALGALGTMGEFGMAFADEVTDCLDDVDKNVRDAAGLSLQAMGLVAAPMLEDVEEALPEPAVFATVKTVPAEAEVGWSQMGDMFSFSRDQLQELLKQGEH